MKMVKLSFFPENMPTIYGEPTEKQLDEFISNRKSFKIVDLQETGYWAERIEKKDRRMWIESKKLYKFQVYTWIYRYWCHSYCNT